ncbi:hypothetical protein [Vibrio sp. SCSIO 43136]|uniref:hypothetical protein n=1 Tax=Vibrio sp. SCSIO 43136 TaxID=2819101 RepID=UPI0020762521|nr:hypothetical protein [Vibrio sp. SCSIO 43136]USD67271.1 hypothetical protein J4N39_21810 [Vibrio sp. SCSIO 43136]
MLFNLHRLIALMLALLFTNSVWAHYPILDCKIVTDSDASEHVLCEASFSNRAKAPNVLMEVFSEDDDVLSSGLTDDDALYRFPKPEGSYFILMDAGPGHVLEISNDDVAVAL